MNKLELAAATAQVCIERAYSSVTPPVSMDISINDLVCYSALNFPKQRADEHGSESKKLGKRDKEKKEPLVLHLLFSSEDSFVSLWVSAAFIYFSLSHTLHHSSLSPCFTFYYIRSRSTNELHCSYVVVLLRT